MEATLNGKYPRYIVRPEGADVLVKTQDEHIARFPIDYEEMVNGITEQQKAKSATIEQQIAAALEADREIQARNLENAVAEERERCAKLAEDTGGKPGKAIAAAIRGVEAPAEPALPPVA